MLFRRQLYIRLVPSCPNLDVPFHQILQRLMAVEFEPRRSREVLGRCERELGLEEGLLLPDAAVAGGALVGEALLFPKTDRWRLEFRDLGGVHSFEVEEELEDIGALLRLGMHSSDDAAFREAAEAFGEEVLDFVLASPEVEPPRWPTAVGPGLQRREHASLLVRSRTTSLLLDPIALQHALPQIEASPLHRAEEPAALLITHSHEDHFHLPSIFQAAGSQAAGLQAAGTDGPVPVIVPAVERPNLLTLVDMQAALSSFGQPAECPAWGTTRTVGDIEIDILPFYGEQPTAAAPGALPGLRSFGNCYRLNTPEFSALVLVDGGTDPTGSMEAVVEASRRRRGPVDVVLSCLRRFACPFFGGLDHYWAALPLDRLAELYREYRAEQLPSTTAGIEGTVALCAAAGARYFLPYANGFAGPGRPVPDIGWGAGEPSEAEALSRLAEGLTRTGCTTLAKPWTPGETMSFSSGRMKPGSTGPAEVR